MHQWGFRRCQLGLQAGRLPIKSEWTCISWQRCHQRLGMACLIFVEINKLMTRTCFFFPIQKSLQQWRLIGIPKLTDLVRHEFHQYCSAPWLRNANNCEVLLVLRSTNRFPATVFLSSFQKHGLGRSLQPLAFLKRITRNQRPLMFWWIAWLTTLKHKALSRNNFLHGSYVRLARWSAD